MSKLFMMIGLPGSGKSYHAEKLSKEYDALVLSSDELRKQLYGDITKQEDNNKIFEELHNAIKFYLKEDRNVVYDATNISYKRRIEFLKSIESISNIEKIAVLVATPIEKCFEQNSLRDRVVPNHVIDRMYKQFYVPMYCEGWDNIQIIWNECSNYNKERLFTELDIEQDNPHHTLKVLNHCMQCCSNIVDVASTNIILGISAMLHDNGKPYCKTFENKKNDIEIWKYIDEFQNRYEISNFGNIRNSKNKKPLKGRLHSGGYLQVNIINNGNAKNYYIHRLVAQEFIENPENYSDVNHIDGNKQNNFYKNLEWCTRSENQIHAFYTNKERNKYGIDKYNSKLTYEQIDEIKNIKSNKKISNKKISEIYNVDESVISRVLNNKTYINKIKDKVNEISPILPIRYASYYGHENVGAYNSLFYTKNDTTIKERESLEIAKYIQFHMLLHNDLSNKSIIKYRNLLGKEFMNNLAKLKLADEKAK